MATANVVPNPRERESKLRQRKTVSADHKGKYLMWCKTDFSVVAVMPCYDRFLSQYQSKTPNGHVCATERMRHAAFRSAVTGHNGAKAASGSGHMGQVLH